MQKGDLSSCHFKFFCFTELNQLGSGSSCLSHCQTGKLKATCESGGDKMTSNCLTGEDPILGRVPVYPAKYALADEHAESWEKS